MPAKTMTWMNVEDRKSHAEAFGGYNDFPPGWHEVTAAQFATSPASNKVITMVEFRQMTTDRSNPSVSAQLFFADDNTGWAVQTEFWAGHFAQTSEGDRKWDGLPPVRFYLFGCEHEEDEDKTKDLSGRCFAAEFTCKKCGRVRVEDSSD